jgi:hypothetical protein
MILARLKWFLFRRHYTRQTLDRYHKPLEAATDDDSVQLVVAADEPALFFRSIESAASYLEAIDVANGVYRAAYGPSGECYLLEIVDGKVKIRRDNSQAAKPEELRKLLHKYLAAAGKVYLPDATLPQLLAACGRDSIGIEERPTLRPRRQPFTMAMHAAMILIGVALVYLASIPILYGVALWPDNDWNSDGAISVPEFLGSLDYDRRPATGECVEYYRLKDGLPVKEVCP